MAASTVVISFVVPLLLFILSRSLAAPDQLPFPYVARSKNAINPVASALASGYREWSKLDKPFYMTYWTKKLLILPPKYLSDIRRANRDHVSFQSGINHVLFQYKWLDGVIKTELNQVVLLKGMNPQLPKLSGPLMEEADLAMSKLVGDDPKGKEIGLVDFAMDTSLRTFSRALGGKDFARDEAFFTAFKAWGMGGMITAMITLYIPFHAVRHTLGWSLAMYQKHVRQRRLHNAAKKHVVRRMQEKDSNEKEDEEIDTLQMAIDLLSNHPLRHQDTTPFVDLLTSQLWQLTWAGAQSPSMSLANMIAQVLEASEHAELLREEAKVAVESHGWTDAMLTHLPLMDSFIREVHRIRPTLGVRVERKVMNKPFTFSDGLTLPPNTFFAFPGAPCAMDPDLLVNPSEFDIHRFVNSAKRDKESDNVNGDVRWSASQAGFTNLAFGYGNHVCPGRFLAVRGLKIILARLLLEYEISWSKSDKGEGPMVFEGLEMPSPGRKIVVRRRESLYV